MVLLVGCICVVSNVVSSDAVSGNINSQAEPSADPFERHLPINYNDYRFLYYFKEQCEWNGVEIPTPVSFVEYDGMNYWLETDSNGNRVAQLVNIGYVTEGEVVTVPESIVHEGETYTVVSVGICFQPLSYYDSVDNEYLTHVGICGNPVEIPTGIDESGYQHLSEPIHYSIIFTGTIKVQDYAFSEFDLFHGTTGAIHCYYTKSGLTSVTFAGGVSSIGQWAFAYSSLESISIPESVQSVESHTFFRTPNLQSVNWMTDADIPDYAFKQSSISEITISGDPQSIGEEAFQSSDLVSITIPNSVLELGDRVFQFCDELTSVSFGQGISVIPVGCFNYCSNLVEFNGQGTIREVRDGAFYGGPKLDSFDFSGIEKIGERAFAEVFQGNERIFFDLSRVKRIESGAFLGTTAPVELILSSELEYVGVNALSLSGNLTGTEITIPAGCVVDKGAFISARLTSVTLGDRCTVNTNAFKGCTELESLIIGENCIFDGSAGNNGPEGIFAGSGLKNVTVPASLTLGRAAFLDCGSLEGVVFEDGRTLISEDCFRGCNNLTHVVFPEGLKTVGMHAFADCSKLDLSETALDYTVEEVLSWDYTAFIGTASIKEYRLFEGDLDGTISFLMLKLVVDGNPTSCSFMVDIVGAKNSMNLDEPYAYYYTMPMDLVGIYDAVLSKPMPRFEFPNGLYQVSKDDGAMYDTTGFTLVKVPYNQLDLHIPDNVVCIAPKACASTKLTYVYIPSSVTEIGAMAFYSCTKLNVVEFGGNGLKYVGDRAFMLTDLEEVTLPSSLEYIGDYAFSKFGGGFSIVLPCDSELVHIGEGGLDVVEGGSVFIPSTISEVGDIPFGYSMAEIYLGGDPSFYPSSILRSQTQERFQNNKWDLAHPYNVTFYLPLGTDISGITFDQLLGCEGGRFGGYFVPTPSGPLVVDEKVVTSAGDTIYLYSPLGDISDLNCIDDGDGIIISMSIRDNWTQYDVVCGVDKGQVSILDSESPYVLRFRVSGNYNGAVLAIEERTVSDTVTVTFDSEGGSGCHSVSIGAGRTISQGQYPIPIKNCSEFLGWVDTNGVEIKPYSPIYDDIVLYAQWAEANPRIVFDDNAHMVVTVNGVQIDSGHRVLQDDVVSVEWIAMEGYTFERWTLITINESMDITDMDYSFSDIIDDTEIILNEGYYNLSDSIRYINHIEFPEDYDAFYLQWMTSFVQDTSGSMWTGGSGTPLVVNGCLYTAAGDLLYRYDLDTGHLLNTVDTQESGGYYRYLGYANGLIFDYEACKVYDLDLNYICESPAAAKVLWDDTGIYLGGSGALYKYSLDMKQMIWSFCDGYVGYSSWGVTGGLQIYDGYLYWIGVKDNVIRLQSVDTETGSDFHEVVLEDFKNYLLDDGWITCSNDTIYFTIYSTGLFGDNSGASGGGVVALSIKNGVFSPDTPVGSSPDYRYYQLGSKAHSNFIVFNGRGYVNSGYTMVVFDVDEHDGKILQKVYEYKHSRYTHGGIVLNNPPGSDTAEIIFIPYDPTMSIMVFYDTPGQTLPKYRNIFTQVPSQYNTQAVRFTDDGRIYFYNDAGNVCVLGNRVENLFLIIREDNRISCISYKGTIDGAISEYDLSEDYKYMLKDFPGTAQLSFDESLTDTYTKYLFSNVPLKKAIFKDGLLWYSEEFGLKTIDQIRNGYLYLDGAEFMLVDKDEYGYTIRFVDSEGNEIKSAITGHASAGAEIDISGYLETKVDGYKHVAASSERLKVSPDESRNVVTLTYDVTKATVIDLVDKIVDGEAIVNAEVLQVIADDGCPAVFVLPRGKIELDSDILKSLSGSGLSLMVALDIIEIQYLEEKQREIIPDGAEIFSISLRSGEEYVHELGGVARITLPITVTGNNLAVWYIDDAGNMHKVGGAVFSNGSVTFSITHLSYYLVGEEVVSESIEPNQYLMIIVVVVIAAVILLGTALFVKKKRAI
jgi:hypothetical protein